MAKIVYFNTHSKTAPGRCIDNFQLNSEDYKENPDMNHSAKVFRAMKEAVKDAFGEVDWGRERGEEGGFAALGEKYEIVYAFMPSNVTDKIPYIAQEMLCLVSGMFNNQNKDEQLQFFYDYGDFLYKGLEPIMFELEKEYKANSKIVPFYKFEIVEEKDLEDAIRECLEKIIMLSGEGKEEEDCLTALYKLFNLDIFLNRKMVY